MGGYVKKKKDMVFQSVDSLQQIVNVVNEAAAAVNDSKRTIKESAIPEVLAGALGAGIGGVGSFAALYGLGRCWFVRCRNNIWTGGCWCRGRRWYGSWHICFGRPYRNVSSRRCWRCSTPQK